MNRQSQEIRSLPLNENGAEGHEEDGAKNNRLKMI
jgi:hypothetical protein